VFPFSKFPQARHFLGPEMRSTGEVMGISDSFGESFAKASIAAGSPLPEQGTLFVSLNDNDKRERALNVVRRFVRLGFGVVATGGTAEWLNENGLEALAILKAREGDPNVVDMIRAGKIQIAVNTPLGESSRFDENAIGRAAVEYRVPYITTLSAAASAARSIEWMREQEGSVRSIQEYHEVAGQGGRTRPSESLEDCTRLVEYIRAFQM